MDNSEMYYPGLFRRHFHTVYVNHDIYAKRLTEMSSRWLFLTDRDSVVPQFYFPIVTRIQYLGWVQRPFG